MPLDGSTFHRPEPDGLRRLRRLLVVMEAAPPEAVDIGVLHCGTAACVYGHGMRDATLYAEWRRGPGIAWASFLGITRSEERRLTLPHFYPNPIGAPAKAEAIRRIRALIAKYEAIHMAGAEAAS